MFPLSGVTTDSAASAAGAHATGWARSTRGPAHITNGDEDNINIYRNINKTI